MDKNTEIFCSRLKAEIERQGVSYPELEKRSGIAKSSIYRYAHGQTKGVPITNVKKIAKALNVSAEYLMGWDTGSSITPASEEQLMVALFGGADEVTAEMWDEVREFAEFVKTKYNKK